MTDTALKTADAGYLTRRLVDTAHDCIVRSEDCGTKEGLIIRRAERPKSFPLRLVGRVLAKDIVNSKGKMLVPTGTLLGDSEIKIVEENGINEIFVRSPLTCNERHGICVKCYGRDLSKKGLVGIGVPVGVVAAQSIGEPGTQLTLRTKHSGGVVGVDVTQGLPRVEELF